MARRTIGHCVFTMLRCRPSEITLTTRDVEETRRRMANRRTIAPSRGLSTRPLTAVGPRGRTGSGLPKLRRGPDHSLEDAVARPKLGSIPLLRPQAAVHSSADSDSDDSLHPSPSRTALADEDPGDFPSTSLPSGETSYRRSTEAGRYVALPSTPNRLVRATIDGGAPSRGNSQSSGQATPANDPEKGSNSSPKRYQFGFPRLGQARTNTSEDVDEHSSPTRLQDDVDGIAESVEALSLDQDTAAPRRVHSIRQHSSHVPSPLHQAETASPPRNAIVDRSQVTPTQSSTEVLPPLLLRGYLEGPDRYSFREYPPIPHTEPRQPVTRARTRPRTASTRSDPTRFAALLPQPSNSQEAPLEDVFWSTQELVDSGLLTTPPTSAQEEHHPSTAERFRTRLQDVSEALHSGYSNVFRMLRLSQEDEVTMSERPHRRASQRARDVSGASSQPFSFYELPASRQPSDNYAHAVEELPQAQVDGSVASQPMRRGAYHSIRPSQIGVMAGTRPAPVPRASSVSLPDLATASTDHLLSCAPSRPYASGAASRSTTTLSPNLITAFDLVGEGQDASSAVERNLSSPLDVLQRRASSQLSQLSSKSSLAEEVQSHHPTAFQYLVSDFDHVNSFRRRPAGSGAVPCHSDNRSQTMVISDGRYPEFPPSQGPRSTHPQPVALASSRPAQRRSIVRRRSAQLSSDNVSRDAGLFVTNAPAPAASARTHGQLPSQRERHGSSRSLSNRNTVHIPSNAPQSGPISRNPVDTRGLRFPFQQGRFTRFTQARPLSQTPEPTQSSSSPPSRGQRQTLGYTSTAGPRISPVLPSTNRTGPSATYNNSRTVSSSSPPITTPRISPVPPNQQSDVNEPQRRLPVRFASRPTRAYPERPASAQTSPPDRQVSNLRSAAGNTRPQLRGAGGRGSRRRMPSSQQDQENSLAAEMGLMRDELLAVGVRYDEDGQQDFMDDTPPRLGRFERRMGDQTE